jgi:hypothetical protein
VIARPAGPTSRDSGCIVIYPEGAHSYLQWRHPLRGHNLYVTPQGYFQCGTCHRDIQRRRYAERAAEGR